MRRYRVFVDGEAVDLQESPADDGEVALLTTDADFLGAPVLLRARENRVLEVRVGAARYQAAGRRFLDPAGYDLHPDAVGLVAGVVAQVLSPRCVPSRRADEPGFAAR